MPNTIGQFLRTFSAVVQHANGEVICLRMRGVVAEDARKSLVNGLPDGSIVSAILDDSGALTDQYHISMLIDKNRNETYKRMREVDFDNEKGGK